MSILEKRNNGSGEYSNRSQGGGAASECKLPLEGRGAVNGYVICDGLFSIEPRAGQE